MRGAVGICARVPVSVFRRWWLRGHARHGKGDSSPVCEHGTCRRLVPRKTMPVSRYRCNDVPYRTPLEFHSGAHVTKTHTWQRQSATQTPRVHTLVHAEFDRQNHGIPPWFICSFRRRCRRYRHRPLSANYFGRCPKERQMSQPCVVSRRLRTWPVEHSHPDSHEKHDSLGILQSPICMS